MQLSKKQNEYIIHARNRWNIKVGAVRSGKSFVDVSFIIPYRIRERIGMPGNTVILGVSKETIERNVLKPMREIYTDKLVGEINNRNKARICGEDVYCLGAEKVSQVSKIRGDSIKYCYGDEIAEWNQDVFRMLQSRLDKTYSCFDGACNPEHPTHWLKTFIDNPKISINKNLNKNTQRKGCWQMARPKMEESKKCIRQNISMDPEQLKQLEEYCQREERSMSWVIRKALEGYLIA